MNTLPPNIVQGIDEAGVTKDYVEKHTGEGESFNLETGDNLWHSHIVEKYQGYDLAVYSVDGENLNFVHDEAVEWLLYQVFEEAFFETPVLASQIPETEDWREETPKALGGREVVYDEYGCLNFFKLDGEPKYIENIGTAAVHDELQPMVKLKFWADNDQEHLEATRNEYRIEEKLRHEAKKMGRPIDTVEELLGQAQPREIS